MNNACRALDMVDSNDDGATADAGVDVRWIVLSGVSTSIRHPSFNTGYADPDVPTRRKDGWIFLSGTILPVLFFRRRFLLLESPLLLVVVTIRTVLSGRCFSSIVTSSRVNRTSSVFQ